MSLIEALNWRYATKKMNGQAVPQDKVDLIIENHKPIISRTKYLQYLYNSMLRHKSNPVKSSKLIS